MPDSEQAAVASAMADYVARQGGTFQGVLSAGDNFCVGLTGTDDPSWRTLFEDMYDRKRLNFSFYVALGNWDYWSENTQTPHPLPHPAPPAEIEFPISDSRMPNAHAQRQRPCGADRSTDVGVDSAAVSLLFT